MFLSRFFGVSALTAAVVILATLMAQAAGFITATLNAQLTISSTEVAVPFYRDRLARRGGSTEAAPAPSPSAAPNLAGPPGGIGAMVGVPGGSPRYVRMNVPRQTWKIQLIEMTNVERLPVNPRVQDIAAAGLILYVRDLDVTLAAMKKVGTPIITTGGQPVYIGA